MPERHKLALVTPEENKNLYKKKMVDFIEKRWFNDKETRQIDIIKKFNAKLSQGSIINYLNELIDERKLSSYKIKNERFYTPPKIPFSIKLGLALSTLITVICVSIDVFTPSKVVYRYVYMGLVESPKNFENVSVSTLPVLIYSLIIIFIFTSLSYSFEHKLNK